MKKSKWNKNFGRGTTAVLVAMMLLIVTFSAIDISAFKTSNSKTTSDESNEDEGCSECTDCVEYSCMQPDKETLKRWIDSYNAAPVSNIKRVEPMGPAPSESYSVLDHVDYIPGDRDQASCGNCWVWAGTGCMEVAHHVENRVFDRLSVQFLNSNYGDTVLPAERYACCGGWLEDFENFYKNAGMFAIPWGNTNAHWQDWGRKCSHGSSLVDPSDIDTSFSYGITHINAVTISTQTESEAAAINNIKAVLDDDKAVWFAFYLADFDDFRAHWRGDNGEDESSIFDFDDFNGETWIGSPPGGGHAVLCVGYNDDSGTDNDYWIILNSWGDRANRPNGIFLVDMHMDYGFYLDDPSGDWYGLYWQWLDIDFDNSQPIANAGGPYSTSEGTAVTLDASGSSDPAPNPSPLQYRWDLDNDGGWDTGWLIDPTYSYIPCDDYSGQVKVEVSDGELSETDTADLTVINVAPTVDAGSDLTVNEGTTFSFSGSATDQGTCDILEYEWDFGDGNPVVTGTLAPTHAYGDNGVYTVTLKVADDEGAEAVDTLTVTVNNVKPSANIDTMDQPNPQFILPKVHTLTFEATATDPGSDDLTFEWDWNDGTSDTTIYYNDGLGPDPYPSPWGPYPFSANDITDHIYLTPKTYTVTLTVTDDDGEFDTDTIEVTVLDEYGALKDIDEYIQSLPDSSFKKLFSKHRKKALHSKILAINDMLIDHEYNGAIHALRKDIRTKADGYVDGRLWNDWITDKKAQEHICMKIDDLTAYLETFLSSTTSMNKKSDLQLQNFLENLIQQFPLFAKLLQPVFNQLLNLK